MPTHFVNQRVHYFSSMHCKGNVIFTKLSSLATLEVNRNDISDPVGNLWCHFIKCGGKFDLIWFHQNSNHGLFWFHDFEKKISIGYTPIHSWLKPTTIITVKSRGRHGVSNHRQLDCFFLLELDHHNNKANAKDPRLRGITGQRRKPHFHVMTCCKWPPLKVLSNYKHPLCYIGFETCYYVLKYAEDQVCKTWWFIL